RQSGKQLGVHGDDGVGVEPESVVGAAAARGAGSLAGEASGRKALGAGPGVQNLCAGLCAFALSSGAWRSAASVSSAVVEPVSGDLLPLGRRLTLLTTQTLKSESRCSDPCGAKGNPA